MAKRSLYQLARAGDLDGLAKRLELNGPISEDGDEDEDFDDSVVELYKWCSIAGRWHEEATEMADAIQEAQLSRYGDETLALAHFEIGQMWLLGEEGLPVDVEQGFEDLTYAKKVGLDISPKDIDQLRNRLSGEARTRFDKLFAPKKAKPAAVKKKAKANAKAKTAKKR